MADVAPAKRLVAAALVAFVASVALASPLAAALVEPKPLFAFGQDDEVLEVNATNRELRLNFPVAIGGHYYSTVYISKDGLVSFDQAQPSYLIPLAELHGPVVAAFYSDIDASAAAGGKVFFREENRNADELIRFDSLVNKHFGDEIQTKSVLVVTWFRVPARLTEEDLAIASGAVMGRADRGPAPAANITQPKHNTFQLAIGNSEGSSFVAMSYPRSGLQWARATPVTQKTKWPQAGLSDGQGNRIVFRESGGPRMLTLDRRSNVGENGVFLFRLGPTLAAPRPPANFSGDGERKPAATCASNPDPCHPSATCTEGGADGARLCCECPAGAFGDGYLCVEDKRTVTYRVVGRVQGSINGLPYGPMDLFGYANVSSGITYLGMAADTLELATDLQALFSISGGIHWLFGKTPMGGKSGFLLSAGRFNRTTEVEFTKHRKHVKIEEVFNGYGFDNMVRVVCFVSGELPKIRPSMRAQVSEYANVFHRVRPGEFRSNSSQRLQFIVSSSENLQPAEGALEDWLDYNVVQTIRFDENPCDKSLLDDTYKVIVNRASVRVDERSAPFRVHMQSEVDVRVGKLAVDPCERSDCGEALCVPNGDLDFRCVCDQGAEFRRGRCVHASARSRTCADSPPGMCPANGACVDSPRGPFCRCHDGYEERGNRMCEPMQASPLPQHPSLQPPHQPSYEPPHEPQYATPPQLHVTPAVLSENPAAPPIRPDFADTCQQPCHRMASCVPHETGFLCRCMQGTIGDGVSDCRPLTCHDAPHTCASPGGECVAGACRCRSGFVGDGIRCERGEPQDGRERSRSKLDDVLVYARGMTILELPTTPTGQTPAKLLALGDDTSENVGIAIDCDHEHIYWTDSINGKIFRARLDGKNREEVVSGLGQPEGIAVDSSSRNIFWADSERRAVRAASMDRFEYVYTLVDEDLDNPRGIAVHAQRGKVYFSDRSLEYPRIESVSMDGTERTTVVGADLEVPNMLAVDPEMDELCWTDAGRKTIECVSLDPAVVPTVRSRRVVYRSDALRSKLFGIALHHHRVYWTDWETPLVHVLDRSNGSATLQPLRFLPAAGGSSRLYSIAVASKRCPRVRTPCEVRRGECPYMCLPTDSYGRTCVCPDSLREAGRCPSSHSGNGLIPLEMNGHFTEIPHEASLIDNGSV